MKRGEFEQSAASLLPTRSDQRECFSEEIEKAGRGKQKEHASDPRAMNARAKKSGGKKLSRRAQREAQQAAILEEASLASHEDHHRGQKRDKWKKNKYRDENDELEVGDFADPLVHGSSPYGSSYVSSSNSSSSSSG